MVSTFEIIKTTLRGRSSRTGLMPTDDDCNKIVDEIVKSDISSVFAAPLLRKRAFVECAIKAVERWEASHV